MNIYIYVYVVRLTFIAVTFNTSIISPIHFKLCFCFVFPHIGSSDIIILSHRYDNFL